MDGAPASSYRVFGCHPPSKNVFRLWSQVDTSRLASNGRSNNRLPRTRGGAREYAALTDRSENARRDCGSWKDMDIWCAYWTSLTDDRQRMLARWVRIDWSREEAGAGSSEPLVAAGSMMCVMPQSLFLPISKRLAYIVNGCAIPDTTQHLVIPDDAAVPPNPTTLDDPQQQPASLTHLNTQLHQANVRESQLQRALYALEEEFGRSQSNALAFENAMAELTRLRNGMETMSQQLKHEEERNEEMEQTRRALDAEYEALCASLFDQANVMVKEQSMLRADAERRAYMTETRLVDAERIIDSLRSELSSLKLMFHEQESFHQSTYSPASLQVPRLLDSPSPLFRTAGFYPHPTASGEEWQSDHVPITISPPSNLPRCTTPSPDMDDAPPDFVPALAVASPELYPAIASDFRVFLTVLFASTGRPTARFATLIDRENALYRTKFMELLFEQDVKPTLAFNALSWLQKKSLAGTISSNLLAIMPRRKPMLVPRPPPQKSSTTGFSAKFLLPAFNIPSLSGTASPHPPGVTAEHEPSKYAPDTINCWGCGTEIVNLPPLSVLTLSDSDSERPVCQLCREKLVAVCQLFSYIRRLSAGHVPKRLITSLNSDARNEPPSLSPSTPTHFSDAGGLAPNDPPSDRRSSVSSMFLHKLSLTVTPMVGPSKLDPNSKATSSPCPGELEQPLIIGDLTPDLVGALWYDFCRLRQRMFLARLGIPSASFTQTAEQLSPMRVPLVHVPPPTDSFPTPQVDGVVSLSYESSNDCSSNEADPCGIEPPVPV